MKKKYLQVKQNTSRWNKKPTINLHRVAEGGGLGLWGVAVDHSTWFEVALLSDGGSTGNAGTEVEAWRSEVSISTPALPSTLYSAAVQGSQKSNNGEGRTTVNTVQYCQVLTSSGSSAWHFKINEKSHLQPKWVTHDSRRPHTALKGSQWPSAPNAIIWWVCKQSWEGPL